MHCRAAGFEPREDAERGFDHGVFVPLKLLSPDAKVPVVVLSLLASLDAAAHLQMGRALAPLRDDGVLIVGSGASFHSLPAMRKANFRDTTAKHAENPQARVRATEYPCNPPQLSLRFAVNVQLDFAAWRSLVTGCASRSGCLLRYARCVLPGMGSLASTHAHIRGRQPVRARSSADGLEKRAVGAVLPPTGGTPRAAVCGSRRSRDGARPSGLERIPVGLFTFVIPVGLVRLLLEESDGLTQCPDQGLGRVLGRSTLSREVWYHSVGAIRGLRKGYGGRTLRANKMH